MEAAASADFLAASTLYCSGGGGGGGGYRQLARWLSRGWRAPRARLGEAGSKTQSQGGGERAERAFVSERALSDRALNTEHTAPLGSLDLDLDLADG
jgi:hypothetical protein